MGALLWFAKMLLKVMKPLLKVAIYESLVEALLGMLETTDAQSTSTSNITD